MNFSNWIPPEFKAAVYAIGALLVVIICFAFWWVISEPGRQHDLADIAKAQTSASQADSRASDAATGAVASYGDRSTDRAKIDQENGNDILSQPGASTPGDHGVYCASLRSMCKRQGAAGDGRCVQLRDENSPTNPCARPVGSAAR